MNTDLLKILPGEGAVQFHVLAAGRKIYVHLNISGGVITEIRLTQHPQTGNLIDEKCILKTYMQQIIDGRVSPDILPYKLSGTDYQQRIWHAASAIPYGSTVTYGEITRLTGCGSPRSAGQALKANPLPIIIPCHRIVASGGKLGGFATGVEIKRLLLRHENENSSYK